MEIKNNTDKKNKIYKNISQFCHKNLLNNTNVISYLNNRGLNMESIKKFEIGLFPSDIKELFKIENPIELRKFDIIYNASYSRFMIQNLIFPIKDVYNNYISFAGRTLLSEKEREKKVIPKYMNSMYNKGNHLYGLNFAKYSIIKYNLAFVVEGYFDVISPVQNGFKNIVSVCGKYLSMRQIVLLSRFTDRIVLMFDNEEEAQIRAQRIVEINKFKKIKLFVMNPLKNTSLHLV